LPHLSGDFAVTTPTLFTPLRAGDLRLPNRIVMAALTRSRAGRAHIPNELMAEYYAQRASAGLIITEATMIARDGCAFTAEGGLFDEACEAGWQRVTQAVHERDGRILVQLWHPGRAAHSALNAGAQPISSTDRAIRNATLRTPEGVKPYEIPRRLAREEIPGIVALFRAAAQRAEAAGFDGVQIHGAHGYLLDQFLRDSVNDRTDDYGGSLAGRARLLLEAVDAAIDVLGPGRVAVRISPLVPFNDIADSHPAQLVQHVSAELDRRGIAFLELRHADHSAPAEQELARTARQHFRGALFGNGGYSETTAQAALAAHALDAVVFGKLYVGNPDLVERFAAGAPLGGLNPATLYTPGAAGYTDYPSLALAPVGP
jgi:N-ethylmaleimide reductase